MKRTRSNIVSNSRLPKLGAYSELVGRALFAAKLGGQSYGGDRDLYQALGYSDNLNFDDYYARYRRHDMSKAVIDRPVKATWQGTIELVEPQITGQTPLETEWRKLNRKLKLKSKLSRVDRLTGIGRYGVLLLGLDDVKRRDGFAEAVKSGTRKLKYLKPFGEKTAQILEFENNPQNERYGQPKFYNIEVSNAEPDSTSIIKVHHSRVIHIVDDILESEIYGMPRLESVFNRMMDIEKLVGGDAEMFWRGARPGYQSKLDPEFSLSPEQEKEMQDQVDEFEHNLRRILMLEGMDLSALDQQIADPMNHMEIQLICVSAVTGIPKRILSGSERGELSSGQDAKEWKTYVQGRREDHAEPRILRVVVDKFIELGILPTPSDEYNVKWLDLFSISEKERVEIGQHRAEALRMYTTNPLAASIIPPPVFFKYFLGLDTEEIFTIEEAIKDGISTEQKDFMEIIKEISEPAKEIPEGRPISKPERKRVPVKTTE